MLKQPATLSILVLLCAHGWLFPVSAPEGGSFDVKLLWDRAPHNAFTDLIRFKEKWVCGFREAPAHAGGVRDSRMRILASDDWEKWDSVGILHDERGDIRDAKFALMPDGRLIFLTAIQLFDRSRQSHQSLAWFTSDLETWDGPHDVGEPDFWLWGITWYEGTGYSIGYSTTSSRLVRLYTTTDGKAFDILVDNLGIDASYPNESKIVFDADGTAFCLLRTDKRGEEGGDADGKGRLGISRPPYREWSWKAADQYVGGPDLVIVPDGRLLGGGRIRTPEGPRTVLFEVDPETAVLSERLTLPSGGDTSYPGLVWHEDELWMSYYSSHEGKSNIYLGRIPWDILWGKQADENGDASKH